MSHTPHKLGFRIGAIAGAIVLTLLAAEGAVRVFALLGSKDAQANNMRSLAVDGSDDYVLRGPLNPGPGAIRIVFLGDSFAYGLGVEPSEAFAARVEGLLRAASWSSCVTINLGRPGFDVISEWALYNRHRDLLRPALVVQVLSPNDQDIDLYEDLYKIRKIGSGRLLPAGYSRLLDLVEGQIRQAIVNRGCIDYMRGGATRQQQDRSWRIITHEIDQARRLVEEGGGRYMLVRFPTLLSLTRYPVEDVHRRTAEIARQLGIHYLDLLDTFRGRDGAKLRIASGDDHPNAEAHKLAAQAIADDLTRNVLPTLGSSTSTQPYRPRSPEEIRMKELRHYREILEIDPTCRSALFWLNRVMPK